MQYDVFGLGNALVDIQARISDNWLQQTGFDKGIMTLVDDAQQSAVLDRLSGIALHRCAGGSAANTIVAVADLVVGRRLPGVWQQTSWAGFLWMICVAWVCGWKCLRRPLARPGHRRF